MSFADANIRLTRPSHPSAFKDFIELERWIEHRPDGLRTDFQEATGIKNEATTPTKNHTDDNFNHLIEILEHKVSGWPKDQAKAGLELFIATLEGDQQKIDETYPQLTMKQFETIVDIVESLED